MGFLEPNLQKKNREADKNALRAFLQPQCNLRPNITKTLIFSYLAIKLFMCNYISLFIFFLYTHFNIFFFQATSVNRLSSPPSPLCFLFFKQYQLNDCLLCVFFSPSNISGMVVFSPTPSLFCLAQQKNSTENS